MTKKRYKVYRKNKYNHQRYKKISIGKVAVFGSVYGIVYLTIFLTANIRLNQAIKELEKSELQYDFIDELNYVDDSSLEGLRLIEKYNIWMEEEEKNLDEAIDYLTSQDYIEETISNEINYQNNTDILSKSDQNINVKPLESEQTFEEKYIKLYCDIYQVDYDIVYAKLAELTDNFTSEEYLNGTIPGITFKKIEPKFDNREALILAAVRCAKQTPSKLDLKNIDSGVTYISNMTIEQQISYFSDVFGVDKILVYSIKQSEVGMGSSLSSVTNNLGNLRDKESDDWMRFDNPTESIIEICGQIYKYNKEGLYSIEEIGNIYAPPCILENKNWIPNVTNIYQQVQSNFDAVFGTEPEMTKASIN